MTADELLIYEQRARAFVGAQDSQKRAVPAIWKPDAARWSRWGRQGMYAARADVSDSPDERRERDAA